MELRLKQKLVLAALALSGAAFAQTAAPAAAPEPEYTLAYNIGVVTDYRYRGISQTRLEPAIQGGIDFTHKSGFYLGAWASSIKWIRDAGGDASAEIDVYGGYKFTAATVAWDVGVLTYNYPSNNLNPSTNTAEIYGAGTLGPVTLKYSHAVTDLFGFRDSKNSGYFDATANFDLGSGWSIAPHIGYQKVMNNSAFSYTDYSLTVAKDFGNGFTVTAAAVGTNADSKLYVSPEGKFLGKNALVVGAKYSF